MLAVAASEDSDEDVEEGLLSRPAATAPPAAAAAVRPPPAEPAPPSPPGLPSPARRVVRFWLLVATLLAVLSPALPSGLRLLAGASFPSVHGLLERLRAEAEAEAARPINPQQQRSISYALKYWVEISFGVRQKQSNRTAAQQMGLAATPAPATEVIPAPAVEAPALVPHAW